MFGWLVGWLIVSNGYDSCHIDLPFVLKHSGFVFCAKCSCPHTTGPNLSFFFTLFSFCIKRISGFHFIYL